MKGTSATEGQTLVPKLEDLSDGRDLPKQRSQGQLGSGRGNDRPSPQAA
jgi:hypothetical protein